MAGRTFEGFPADFRLRGRRGGPPPLPRRAWFSTLDPAVKIGVAVFLALLAFAVVLFLARVVTSLLAVAAVHQLQVQEARQEAQEAQQQAASDAAGLQERAMQVAYAQQRAAAEQARYYLAADQRCVGGAVVQVDGRVYTQLGSISYPVHCVGRVADRPLR